MRVIEDYVTTTDSRVYKMHRKVYTLGCSFCKPHRGENRRRWRQKSWKIYRKNQYKLK